MTLLDIHDPRVPLVPPSVTMELDDMAADAASLLRIARANPPDLDEMIELARSNRARCDDLVAQLKAIRERAAARLPELAEALS